MKDTMNSENAVSSLTPIERALVAALVSAIVKDSATKPHWSAGRPS